MPIPPSSQSAVEQASALLETLPDSSALIDDGGTILAVNASWRKFAHENGGTSQAYLGENYLEVCQSALVNEIGDLPQQLTEVMKGSSNALEWEYACHAPSERRWFRLTATRFQAQEHSYVVVIHRDISHERLSDEAAKAHEQQWAYLAHHCALTGLPNRRLFMNRLEQAVAQRQRSGETFAVLLLDLNDFKALNDGFGHEIGDSALRALGGRVKGFLKQDDTVARWGGDELLLLVRDLEDTAAISALAERILDAMETPFIIGDQEFRLSVTLGIAIGGDADHTASSLIMQADGAMYSAKDAGQRFGFFAKEVGEAARERMYLGTELARALERDQLQLHYQPQINLRTGECLGLEALVRWNHPDKGWISPTRFIPVAEQSGLIHKLGEWVLDTGCRQAQKWLAEGWDFGHISVNIASQQLNTNSLTGQIDRVLYKTGLPPARLELELTESSLVDPSVSVFNTLEALRKKGIKIAIDDFGTGYSSLGYLKDLPVDRLKIDRSFVDGLPEDGKARALIQTVMILGSKLGFEILAEGIERPAQLQDLIQQGCLAGQGYLFAKPQDAKGVSALRFPLRPSKRDQATVRGLTASTKRLTSWAVN